MVPDRKPSHCGGASLNSYHPTDAKAVKDFMANKEVPLHPTRFAMVKRGMTLAQVMALLGQRAELNLDPPPFPCQKPRSPSAPQFSGRNSIMPTSAFLPKPFKAPGAVFVPAASCSWGVGIPAACNGERVEVSAKLATQVPPE